MNRKSFLSSIASLAAGIGVGKLITKTIPKEEKLPEPINESGEGIDAIRPRYTLTDLEKPRLNTLIIFPDEGDHPVPYCITSIVNVGNTYRVRAHRLRDHGQRWFEWKPGETCTVISHAFAESLKNNK
jgi:hypothetical protein